MNLKSAQKSLNEFIASDKFNYWVGLNTLSTVKIWIELLEGDYKILQNNERPVSEESVVLPLPWFVEGILESEYDSYCKECKESLRNCLLEKFDEWSVEL